MTYFGKGVAFADAGEILHMSGPWAGTLLWGGVAVEDGVMVDSLVPDESSGRLYFVRCHAPTRWRSDVWFRVCFIRDGSDTVCEVRDSHSLTLPHIKVRASGELSVQSKPGTERSLDPNEAECRAFIDARMSGAV